MTDNPYADWLLARAATVQPPLDLHDGKVASGASLPYGVLHVDLGMPGEFLSLTMRTERMDVTAQITAVGEDRNQVDAVRAALRAVLLDVAPDIEGRDCWPIRLHDSQPARRDDDVQPSVMYGVDIYRLSSVPA
ncbi:MAG: hypothetical protein ACJ74O_13515 [Frankiaceae bacterium]